MNCEQYTTEKNMTYDILNKKYMIYIKYDIFTDVKVPFVRRNKKLLKSNINISGFVT